MPGMELRMAFSMTVEPLATSRSWRVPSKATIVSLGMEFLMMLEKTLSA
jgi:hypothetical protein